MSAREDLIQSILSELKSFAEYNPDTGLFIATRQRRANSPKVGEQVGTLGKGHLLVGIKGSLYLLHHLAWLWMTGDFPKNEIDHINGNRQDNRWSNLRDVSCAINSRNSKMWSNNSSGYTGVSWHSAGSKWRAYVQQNHIGLLNSAEEAAEAREAWITAHPELGFTSRHGK